MGASKRDSLAIVVLEKRKAFWEGQKKEIERQMVAKKKIDEDESMDSLQKKYAIARRVGDTVLYNKDEHEDIIEALECLKKNLK